MNDMNNPKEKSAYELDFIGEDDIYTAISVDEEVVLTLSEKEAVKLANDIMNQYYGI